MRKRLTVEDLMKMEPQNIDWEDVIFNGFSGEYQDREILPGQIKVACVGDSITYGHGIYNWPENNYPARLDKLLGKKYHVRNFGVCGQCVQENADQPYTAERRYRESLEFDADILILMMGTNDSKPINWQGEAAFRTAYNRLLDSYLTGVKRPKIILGIPATAFFPDGVTEGITNFNVQPKIAETIGSIVRQIAAERGFAIMDVHALTKNNPQWFSEDHVHPDLNGAAAIAELAYQSIQKE